MDFSSYTVENWPENEETLVKQLEDPLITNQIPLLNVNELEKFKDGALIRFQGMIQDMHGPEYYFEKFEVVNDNSNERSLKNGKYRDACMTLEPEQIDLNSSKNVTSERQSYVVITVPGVNDWVRNYECDKYVIKTTEVPSTSCQSSKRTFDEAMEQDMRTEESTQTKKASSSTINNEQSNKSISTLVSKEYILNFPLPDAEGKTCHLKIYTKSDLLKLNDVCEFIGFLACNPVTQTVYEDDLENKMETETHFPPSSLVPRIHVVCFNKLFHNNPLVNEVVLTSSFKNIKSELLLVLSQILLGDTVAAEYVLYHLISEVYMRRDFLALGKFSVNISNIPIIENVNYVEELYKFIECFMPKSHYLPMTLDNMNTLAVTPKKDYECNRLTSGILQLSPNTHLVLDETKLSPGKLNASGLNSIKAVSYAIKNQKVSYDFNYYHIEYDCDIPFLILSEGKSMLASDSHVVLKPDESCIRTFQEIADAARHFLKPKLLDEIRVYLTLARQVKYEITEGVQDLVQQEFVSMRQKGAVSADDLHGLLVLARLISVSEGKTSLDQECWKKACGLEAERKSRLNLK